MWKPWTSDAHFANIFFSSKALPNSFNFFDFPSVQIINFCFCHCSMLQKGLLSSCKKTKHVSLSTSVQTSAALAQMPCRLWTPGRIFQLVFSHQKVKEVTLFSFCGPWKILRSQRRWGFEPLGSWALYHWNSWFELWWDCDVSWGLAEGSKMTLWSKQGQYCWKVGEKRWRSGLGLGIFSLLFLLIQMFHF